MSYRAAGSRRASTTCRIGSPDESDASRPPPPPRRAENIVGETHDADDRDADDLD